jgi:hypothetical protein
MCVGQVGSQPQAEATKLPSSLRVVEKTAFTPRDTAEDEVTPYVVRGPFKETESFQMAGLRQGWPRLCFLD